MRTNVSSRGVLLLLVLALMLCVVAVAGCGGSEKASSSGSPAAAVAEGPAADQIVKDSQAKMATVTSAAFTGDLAVKVQGDTGKMTDPTAQALLAQGVTVHAAGKTAIDPLAVDMTMSLGLAGQNLEFGMKAKGARAWVEYQGTWYAVDSKNAKSLGQEAQTASDPSKLFKSMGFDPATWGMTYQLAGAENLDGVQVYHVKAAADPKKVAESLAKAAKDPNLNKQLGGATSQLGELGQGLTQDPKQFGEIARSFKSAAVDYWIGVDDRYMYKSQIAVTLDMSKVKNAQGLTGITLKGTMEQGDFNQPVEVTPPAEAKSFKQFMNQLFGGLFGGDSGLSL